MPSFWSKQIEAPWLALVSYGLGVFLICCGALYFYAHFSAVKGSPAKAADYVFAIVCGIWGVLIFLAALLKYRGGLWSVIGGFLVGGALTGTVSIVETLLRGMQFDSPVVFYNRIMSCWAIGVVLLLIGHQRHRRLNRIGPKAPLTTEHKRGRRLLAVAFAIWLVVAFCIDGLSIAVGNIQPPPVVFMRLAFTVVLFCAVWYGQRWARWVTLGCFIFAFFLSVHDFVVKPNPFRVLNMLFFTGICLMFVFVLLLSRHVAAFLSYQRCSR